MRSPGCRTVRLLIDRLTQAVALAKRCEVDRPHLRRPRPLQADQRHRRTRGRRRRAAPHRQRLLGAVRPMDSVARLGGDEFVVLLPALDGEEGALVVARRIAAGLQAPMSPDSDTARSPCPPASGSASRDPRVTDADVDPKLMLRQADTAMYHAKSLGGSQDQSVRPAAHPRGRQADADLWIARIREALEKDRFVLHGQPIIDLATGEAVQHELLIRMRDGPAASFPRWHSFHWRSDRA